MKLAFSIPICELGSDTPNSFEYYNLLQPASHIAGEVVSFDFAARARAVGSLAMTKELLEFIEREAPDALICTFISNEYEPVLFDRLKSLTTTIGYFYDEPWRRQYTRFWAPRLTYWTTTDVNAYRFYLAEGLTNAIYAPFGSNLHMLGRTNLPKQYDVTFVGSYHVSRDWIYRRLKKAGFNVRFWGYHGWDAGKVDQVEMAEIFRQSRINLNLSNCICWDVRCALSSLRTPRSAVRQLRDYQRALRGQDPKTTEMIKFRQFEINACGGFQLSYLVEGLEQHYCLGQEIAVYATPDEMLEKTRYYLEHEDEREEIARRGFERTMRDHTMEQRLTDILAKAGVGLPTASEPSK